MRRTTSSWDDLEPLVDDLKVMADICSHLLEHHEKQVRASADVYPQIGPINKMLEPTACMVAYSVAELQDMATRLRREYAAILDAA